VAQIAHNGPLKTPSKQPKYLKRKITQSVYRIKTVKWGKGSMKNLLVSLGSRKDAQMLPVVFMVRNGNIAV